MKIYKLINTTFRKFWTKAISTLERQLRYPGTLEWKDKIMCKTLRKIPLTIYCKSPKVIYNKIIIFSPKNLSITGHHMTLRPRGKKVPETVAALDPGIRTFQTLYDSNNNIVEFGCGDVYNIDSEEIPEIHNKIADYLISKYEIILIPRLLLKTDNPYYHIWKHSQFVDVLQSKAKRTQCKVIEVEEAYTSQTCSRCGFNSHPGSSKTFKCDNCKLVIDRDVNGARNILLKNMIHLGISFKTE